MNLQELTAEECLKLPADILQWLKKDLNLENVEDQEELREKFDNFINEEFSIFYHDGIHFSSCDCIKYILCCYI